MPDTTSTTSVAAGLSTYNDAYAAPAYAVAHAALPVPSGERRVAAGHQATYSTGNSPQEHRWGVARGGRVMGMSPVTLLIVAGVIYLVFIRKS